MADTRGTLSSGDLLEGSLAAVFGKDGVTIQNVPDNIIIPVMANGHVKANETTELYGEAYVYRFMPLLYEGHYPLEARFHTREEGERHYLANENEDGAIEIIVPTSYELSSDVINSEKLYIYGGYGSTDYIKMITISYVFDGADGADGADGQDGVDGKSGLNIWYATEISGDMGVELYFNVAAIEGRSFQVGDLVVDAGGNVYRMVEILANGKAAHVEALGLCLEGTDGKDGSFIWKATTDCSGLRVTPPDLFYIEGRELQVGDLVIDSLGKMYRVIEIEPRSNAGILEDLKFSVKGEKGESPYVFQGVPDNIILHYNADGTLKENNRLSFEAKLYQGNTFADWWTETQLFIATWLDEETGTIIGSADIKGYLQNGVLTVSIDTDYIQTVPKDIKSLRVRLDYSEYAEVSVDFTIGFVFDGEGGSGNSTIKHIKGYGVDGTEKTYITELESGIYTIEGSLYYYRLTAMFEHFDNNDLVFVQKHPNGDMTVVKITTDAAAGLYSTGDEVLKGQNPNNSGIRIFTYELLDAELEDYRYSVKSFKFENISTKLPTNKYNEATAESDYPSWYGVNDFVNTAIETALANFVNVEVNGQ